MVHIKRAGAAGDRGVPKKGVLVGRPFPPMTEHLRVSVGTPDEMGRFLAAFKEIFPAREGVHSRCLTNSRFCIPNSEFLRAVVE